jgi:hypothetical protein
MTLSQLISDENGKKTAAESAIAAGAAARTALDSVAAILDSLNALEKLRAAAVASASASVTAVQAGGTAATADETTLSQEVGQGLAAAGKTPAALQAIVDAELPSTPGTTYADLLDALATAEDGAADKAATAAGKRLDAERKRAEVDLAVAKLGAYVAELTGQLDRARGLLRDAALRARGGDPVRAWWSIARADTLLQALGSADASGLVDALNDACDGYADAFDAWLTAKDELTTARSDAAEAALAVEKAEAELSELVAAP